MLPFRFRRPTRSARRSSAYRPTARESAAVVTRGFGGTEALEDRTLLTAYVVDSADDDATDDGTTMDGVVTLREAIIASQTNAAFGDAAAGEADGDSISFDATVVAINLDEALPELTDDLSIDGGSGVTLIAGADSGIFSIASTETFSFNDLDLIGGVAENGGALSIAGGATAFLTDLDFTGNRAEGTGGGAIYITGDSAVNVSGGTFLGNLADDDDLDADVGSGGAIFLEDGSLAVNGATFDGNIAERAGGAIEVGVGSLSVTDGVFMNNATGGDADGDPDDAGPGNGGAIHVTGAGSAVQLVRGEVTDNAAAGEGGGLWNQAGSTMLVTDTVITGNVASGDDADQGGGGIYNNGGTLRLTGADVSFNVADGTSGSGGGIFSTDGAVVLTDTALELNSANRAGGGIEVIGGTVTLTDSSLFGNDVAGLGDADSPNPGNGGGLHVSGDADVTLEGLTEVVGNAAAAEGGGLWNSAAGTMTIGAGVLIGSNTASGDDADQGGGGIYNDGGTLDIDGATILGNFADGASGSGGGILSVNGAVTISGSTVIADNTANRAGGGIEIVNGSLTTTDTNFTGNSVSGDDANPGNGGAVHITGATDTSFTGGLVQNNTAANEGGGFWNQAGATMTIDGVTFDRNVARGDDADAGGGAVYNEGGNLVVMNARFLANEATGGSGSGGGILTVDGDVQVTDSVFNANTANRAGGGIELAEGATLALSGGRYTRNAADGGDDGEDSDTDSAPGNGGFLHVSGGGSEVTIDGGSFALNTAANQGGALWNAADATLSVTGAQFSTNTASGSEMGDGGGAVYNLGLFSADDAIFTRNVADGEAGSGGAIINPTGETTVTDSTFFQNTAERAGGAVEIGTGALTITNGRVLRNVAGTDGDGAPGNGGAVHVTFDAITRFDGGDYVLNLAANEGGAFWNSADGDMTVENLSVSGNVASGDDADSGGGGFYNDGGTLRVLNVFVNANLADGESGSGGGLLSTDGVVLVEDSNFNRNEANRAGGGIELVDGDLRFDNSFLRNNVAGGEDGANPGNGGGYHVTGSALAILNGGGVFNNSATNEGGGLWTQTDSRLVLRGVTVRGNSADLGGGVYVNGGRLDIEQGSRVLRNRADGNGAGVFNNDGVAYFDGASQIRRNVAGVTGGGLFADDDSRNIVRDALFAGNDPVDIAGPGIVRGDTGGASMDRDGDGEED